MEKNLLMLGQTTLLLLAVTQFQCSPMCSYVFAPAVANSYIPTVHAGVPLDPFLKGSAFQEDTRPQPPLIIW